MQSMNEFKELATFAAQEAAHILMDNFGALREKDIESKSKSDFVTWVDKSSEQRIIEIIREKYPHHNICAEESTQDEAGEYRWIIDPLDGTTNYIHGVPVFAVSIGLEWNGRLVLGVVYDPNRKEMFYGEKGGGAFLNGKAIAVSKISDPAMALLATGYPFRVNRYIDVYQQSFKELFLQVSGVRRAGSAALDLCYVACGRYDGFWELDLKAWDLAAAAVIIKEAGGKISDFAGGDNVLDSGNTVAANAPLYPFLLQTVKKNFAGTIDA